MYNVYLYNVALFLRSLHGVEAKIACFGQVEYLLVGKKKSSTFLFVGPFSTHKKGVQKRGEKIHPKYIPPCSVRKNKIMILNQF